MSRSIDQRIVEMRFDNREFEAKSKESIKTLEALKKSLDLDGASKSLNDLSKAGKSFSLADMANGVESLASKFTALDVIAFTVLQNLTNAAINFGKKLTGMILDPLIEGGKRRALNIQQAKFQFEGLGMDVEATMASALAAVEGTAYGLDEAAKVASQLGASGMSAGDDMVRSLRAVAGVAAMTNSSYEDMGNIFTTVAGNGRLMGNQLLQLSGRGINAAAAIAENMGISEQAVREMVSKGKISFKDFTDAMDNAFGKHAQAANKMFSGAAANLRSAFARIGADIAGPAFENLRDVFNALRPVINTLHKALKPLISVINEFQAKVTKRWVSAFEAMDISPISSALDALINIFSALGLIIKPITTAFRQIFPPYTTTQLSAFTEGLKNLTERFKIGETASEDLRRTFAGLFAVLDVMRMVFFTIAKGVFKVFETMAPLTNVVLKITASLGDFAVSIRDVIKSTDVLNGLLDIFKRVLNPVVNIVTGFTDIVVRSFNSLAKADTSGFESFLESIKNGFKPLSAIGQVIGATFAIVIKGIEYLMPLFRILATVASNAFQKIQDKFGELMSKMDIGSALGAVISAGIAVFIMNTNNVMDMFRNWLAITRKPVLEFNNMMFNVKTSLMTWQAQLKADILIKIATAIAILAAGLWLLSTIDPGRLASSLAAMTGIFVQLIGSLLVYEKAAGGKGVFKLMALGGALKSIAIAALILSGALVILSKIDPDALMVGLSALTSIITMLTTSAIFLSKATGPMMKGIFGIIAFAIAIDILAKTVIRLSQLDPEGLIKGLVGVGVLLASLAIFLKVTNFQKFSATKALGLIALATAINILATAVKKFGDLSVKQLTKGLGAMGAVLVQLAIFLKLTGGSKKVISNAIGLTILAGAMHIFASAIQKMGQLSVAEIGKGLGTMAGALLIIAVALRFMPKNMVSSALGMVVIASSLLILSSALKKMGALTWEEIAKGLIVLASSLTIIAIAVNFMSTALPGAAALLIVSAALLVLAGVLKTLGKMSLTEIGLGLLALAGVFGVLAIAGYLLTPVIPTLLGLAAASFIFGLAAVAVGVGLLAFSAGLTALALAGTAGAGALVLIVTSLLSLIPLFFVKVAEGIIAFVVAFKDSIVILIEAFVELGVAIIKGLVDLIPPLLDAAGLLISKLLTFLVQKIPELTNAGMLMILGFLTGVASKIEQVTRAGIDVLLGFIRGINSKMGEVVDTAFKTIISFINGLATSIRENGPELRKAGWNLIKAIIGGILGVFKDIRTVGKDVVKNLIDGVKGMAGDLWKQGLDIGKNLISSMTSGITSMAKSLGTAATNAAKSAVDGVKNFLGIRSPSRVFGTLGVDSMQGLVNGISSMNKNIGATSKTVGQTAIEAMKKAVSGIWELIDDDVDNDIVITPILDLDKVKEGLKDISNLFNQPTLNHAYSTGSANMIAKRSSSRELEKAKDISRIDSGSTYNINLDGIYHIREEADIQKLSKELAIEIDRKRRA